MSDHPGTVSFNADAKEFLLEEYRSLSTALETNEQIGETRVNWFIGIVTAVTGGLVAMVSAEKGGVSDNTLQLIVIGLLGLLIFGFVTLSRILKRNATTDGLIKDIKRIRVIFRDYYDPDSVLLNYSAFGPPPGRSDKEEDSDEEEDRKFGGLADLVSALNSLVIAALVGAILFPQSAVMGWSAAATAFSLSFWLLRLYVRKKHNEVKEELRAKKPFKRAGGVVFKFENGVPKYLFACPSKDADGKWILPKGKIDGEEEARETALREVAEETGVFARLLRPLSIMEFPGKAGLVRTKFYLMERILEGEPLEQRAHKPEWFSLDEVQAKKGAFHPETKKLLRIAEQRVRELRAPGGQPEPDA